MKKTAALLLAVVLAFQFGCAKPPEPEPDPTPEPPVEDNVPASSDGPESVEIDISEVAVNVDPLTGLACEKDLSKTRPIAIMLNNHPKSLPQAGIQSAGIIYEVLAEGGMTRLLAVFSDPEVVPDRTGTVRSSRPYYIQLAQGHDAIYVHFGGSEDAFSYLRQNKIDRIDGINYDGTYFYRDKDRRKNKGLEHSAFTTGELMTRAIEKLGIRATVEAQVGPAPFSAVEIIPPEPCRQFKCAYSQTVKAGFLYDPEAKLYNKTEYGEEHMDENTGKALTVKNVLVLAIPSRIIKGDAYGRLTVDVIGSGSGYYMTNGGKCDIKWTKASATSPIVYTLADGTPLQINPGNTYVSILPGLSDLKLEEPAAQ